MGATPTPTPTPTANPNPSPGQGDVVYNTSEFLEKNDDSMAAAIEQVLLP